MVIRIWYRDGRKQVIATSAETGLGSNVLAQDPMFSVRGTGSFAESLMVRMDLLEDEGLWIDVGWWSTRKNEFSLVDREAEYGLQIPRLGFEMTRTWFVLNKIQLQTVRKLTIDNTFVHLERIGDVLVDISRLREQAELWLDAQGRAANVPAQLVNLFNSLRATQLSWDNDRVAREIGVADYASYQSILEYVGYVLGSPGDGADKETSDNTFEADYAEEDLEVISEIEQEQDSGIQLEKGIIDLS